MVQMKKYRVVSLFSGAMGLDLGLEQSGRFELLAAVEKEPSFCATIRLNREAGRLPSNLRVYQADVSTLDPLEILDACGIRAGEVDLLVGGPPCQAFSTAGKRAAVEDPRGTLLWEFLRFVDVMQPRFFLMENVRGLLSAALRHRPLANRPDKGGLPLNEDEAPGSVVRRFADDLQQIGGGPYHMDCFEVNAVNYGAPQLRERVFFIGNRYNAQVDFPNPTHGPADQPPPSDLFEQKRMLPWRTLGDALRNVSPGEVIMDFSPRKKGFLEQVPPGSNWRSLPIATQQESMGKAWFAKGGRSGWWRRLSFDLPCPTLVTMPNHASTSLCHPQEARALSLREYAAIQEFPADWAFVGTPTQQYAQVGNAVPIRLGTVAGQVIAEGLDALSARRWRPYSKPKEQYRILYIQSHVRTRKWFKGGETFVRGEAGSDSGYVAPVTMRQARKLAAA